MERYVLHLDYYFDDKKLDTFNAATLNEKVSSHFDHLESIFHANALKVFNIENKKEYFFTFGDLKSSYDLTFKELIKKRDKCLNQRKQAN